MYTADQYKEGQLLLFDKPLGWTSFQLVNKVRWLIRTNCKIKKIKVGHAGTLDPLASGLLIVCVGKMTKQINEFMGQPKEYTGTVTLGATTPSYDLETAIDHTYPIDLITEEQLYAFAKSYTGSIMQRPPVFSALKREGKRLYEYARQGEEVDIPKRAVEIHSFDLTRIAMPEVEFKVVCSKGTYIRSLAYDFGEALQNGGHLTALRRTKIGDYSVDNALSLSQFEDSFAS